jgi:hypothetical protein
MISFEAKSAASFHTPRCGPGRVQRCAGPQSWRDLPPVHLHHFTVQIENRDDHRPVEVLVPALLAQDADLLQPFALLGAGAAVRCRRMIAQRAVGEPQPELLDHLRGFEAALYEILLRFGCLFQRLVVVLDHAFKQPLVVDGVPASGGSLTVVDFFGGGPAGLAAKGRCSCFSSSQA